MTGSYACEVAWNKLEDASRNRELPVAQIKLLLRIADASRRG